MRHERCAVNHTLEGGPCRRSAALEYLGERICDHHARRFASVNEDYDAYLTVEALLAVIGRGYATEASAPTPAGRTAKPPRLGRYGSHTETDS